MVARAPMLSRRRFLALAGAGAAAGVAGGYSFWSNELDVVRTAPPMGRGSGIRIAIASDMHAPHELVTDGAVTEAVRAFDPHLVFILGDSIEQRGDEALVRFYEHLPARVAKYAVLGNWEYWGRCNFAKLAREYERAGVRLLVNGTAHEDIGGRRIDLIGLDDFRAARQDLSLISDLRPDPDALRLVLSHCPEPFGAISTLTATPLLTFSGHTHGGQIAPFGLAAFLPPGSGPYKAGWYRERGSALYVTRGLGNSGVPIRVGARPEVTLLSV